MSVNILPMAAASQFAQFVHEAPRFSQSNRLINCLELFKISAARDGAHFDLHFADMLDAEADPTSGETARLLTKLEESLPPQPGGLSYAATPSVRFPHSFELFADIAERAGRDDFIAALMGPSGVQLPMAERSGLRVESLDLDSLRQQFAQQHCIRLQGLFDPDLIAEILDQIDSAQFGEMYHAYLGTDFTMDFGPTQALLHYLVTDERFVRAIERVSGLESGELVRFGGRVYRMQKDRDSDRWHKDIYQVEKRLVGLSMSLNRRPVQGGRLRMRRTGWWKPFLEADELAAGDVLVFRVSWHLEHRVGVVSGDDRRTQLVGWYCPNRAYDYRSWLKQDIFGDTPGRRLANLGRRFFASR